MEENPFRGSKRKAIELYSLFTDKVLEISEEYKVSVKITVDYSRDDSIKSE
ncbi:MAG: hypothetical protein KAT88_08205 [Spirochaetes bacterium]|nr:hypothetical protein [Spirochaetota bacterium]